MIEVNWKNSKNYFVTVPVATAVLVIDSTVTSKVSVSPARGWLKSITIISPLKANTFPGANWKLNTSPTFGVIPASLKTDPETLSMEDDTKLILIGELMRWTGSVMSDSAKGFIKTKGLKEQGKNLNEGLKDFAEYFYDEIFKKYCHSDISLLRSRLNGFLGGCEAYYVANCRIKRSEEEKEND